MNIYALSKFKKRTPVDKHQCLHCQNLICVEQNFCCHGCEMAYKICSKIAVIIQPKNNITFSDYVKKDSNKLFGLTLDIENIDCFGCIQHIQKTISKELNIVTVRIIRKKIYIAWRGNAQQADYFVNLITNLGYIVSRASVSHDNNFLKKGLSVGFGVAVMMVFSLMLLPLKHGIPF